MSARVLAKNATWSALCHVLTRGSLVLSAILLARALETSSFAAYSYFQLTISMLAGYAAMGLGIAASLFFAQTGTDGEDASTPLLGTVWALSVWLAVASCVVVLALPTGWLAGGLGLSRWLLALGVLVLTLQVVPDGAILGLEKYAQAAAIAGVAATTTLVGAFIAARLNQPTLAMGTIVAASLVQSIAETVVVLRVVGWRRIGVGLKLKEAHVRRVFGVAGPMFLVTLMAASGGWLVGRLILHGPGGPQQFAVFSIGLQWFALALFLPGVVSRVLLPRMVRSAANRSEDESARRLVRMGSGLALGAALVIALAGFVLNGQLAALYGERYGGLGIVIATFLVAGVVFAPSHPMGNAIIARDGQWQWLALTSMWFILLLGAGYVLRARGGMGGGVTYVFAYGAQTVAAFLLARKRSLV